MWNMQYLLMMMMMGEINGLTRPAAALFRGEKEEIPIRQAIVDHTLIWVFVLITLMVMVYALCCIYVYLAMPIKLCHGSLTNRFLVLTLAFVCCLMVASHHVCRRVSLTVLCKKYSDGSQRFNVISNSGWG
jgi:hypothetical protein